MLNEFRAMLSTMLRIAFAALFTVFATVASAEESEPTFDTFSLSAEASAEVSNDLMTATLSVIAEDKDAAVLAGKINADMAWAVNELKAFDDLSVQTQHYQTRPRYDSSQARRLIGWRGSQSLSIETDDFEQAGKAIQVLQERLQVQGMQLSVKPETRRTASDALINEALDAFKARAALVQSNLGASGYRIIQADIQTGGGMQPYMRSMRMEAADGMAATPAPSIEGGSTQVTVNVHGRIQLQ